MKNNHEDTRRKKTELKTFKPILKEKFQVETIGIFGSYSRGEQKNKSDLDILATLTQPNDIDLLDLIELKQFLSRKLKTNVDVVQKTLSSTESKTK